MAQPVRSDLRYSADHEWLSAQTPARVGVSAVAADALGEVVFVELPEAGAAVEAGEPCGELESTTSVHVLAAVWPAPVILADADPFGSDLLYRLRGSTGLPLDAERGLLSLAAQVRRSPDADLAEHTTTAIVSSSMASRWMY